MSQHSAVSTTSTNQTQTTTNVTTATTLKEESSSTSSATKSGSTSTGSLKKQKNKDAEIPITDDFVLMSTPDKFKDKNINDSNVVVKRLCTESSSTSSSSPTAAATSTLTNEKVNLECLLLSDLTNESKVPVHVETLLKYFDNSQPTQAEILLLLVYVVALECGYVMASHYDQVKFAIKHLSAIATFHAKNILHLSHYKPNFNASEDKTRFSLKLHTLIDMHPIQEDYLYTLLTAMVTGDFLIVSLTPSPTTGAKGFSLALSIGRYILSLATKKNLLHQRFRKMDELSYVLRNQLFVPMRCQQLVSLECSIYPSLSGLPTELYDHILKYLNKNQLNILSNVNKSLYNLCKISKFMTQSKGCSMKNIL